MRVIFDDVIGVQYGFVFLTPDSDDKQGVDLDDARAGQQNGLLGAGVPGRLLLTTGTHTGAVSLRIEWCDDEPADNAEWEDVVEASLVVTEFDMTLSTFDEFYDVAVPSLGDVRARLGGVGLDAGSDAADPGDLTDEEYLDLVAPDRYLLQLWPAPPEPDRIVRTGSDVARYWHGVARDLVPLTPEQRRAREAEREASYEYDDEASASAEDADYPAMSKDHDAPAGEAQAAISVVPDDEGGFGWMDPP